MKKNKPPKADKSLFYWLIVFIVLAVFSGCMTQKKAEKQQDKIIEKYPLIAAGKLRARFPITTTKETITVTVIDSADFVRQRDSSLKVAAKSKKSLDSIREKIKSLPEAVQEICGDYELAIDELIEENKRLNRLLANQVPVIIYRDKEIEKEDSSKIFELVQDRDKWKGLYAIDHDWRVLREKKEKGSYPIYFPKWMLWAIIIGLLVYIGFRNKAVIKKLVKSIKN